MTALPNRRRLALAATAALLAGLLTATLNAALGASAAVPAPSGWTPVFTDDFTGAAGTGVNTANWQYTTGTSYPGGPAGFGTGEIETMTAGPSNVSLDGAGNLRITPQRDAAGNWTSGRIETRRSDFQPAAGGKLRVEARMQLPDATGAAARGYWPAFWMLGAPYRGNWWNWPMVGEIDIMENVQGINNEWATMHCGTSPGGPCNEKSGIGGQRACTGTTCQGGFHTYTMEWDRSTSPEQIRWYLDGVQFHTVTAAQMPANVWADATNHGFFVILNVAMGGEFPAAFGGGPDGATTPGRPLVIDYVGVWSAGGSAPPPSASPVPPVSPPPTCGQLLSRNRPVTVSSIESANQAAAFAVDGDPATRWSSAHGVDPQWITVDLGSQQTLSRVRLTWEAAYATAYRIQRSADNATWTDAAVVVNGDGGVDDLAVSGSGRYIRMLGQQRATVYGYSLWEFEVFGGCGSPAPSGSPTPQPSATQPPSSPPPSSPPPAGGRNAYATIQAESFNQQSGVGVETTTDTGGGQNITTLANGDWALYQNVDFGTAAARQFVARAASGAAGGVSGLVEVRLDSAASAPIGSFAIANTGGWQSWTTIPANIAAVTGTHAVYITFTSGQPADFVNLNWFTFGH
jgi:beta-glucanase (GH16 family)